MNLRCLPLLLSGLLLAGGAIASDADHVKASQAWIRVMPGSLPAGGYVTLENHGAQAVNLRSVSSETYAEVMLHKSNTEGGMGRMEMVDSLSIPAHGKAMLSPGGYHLMLMKATKPVKVGDKVKLSLRFADGSTLLTDFDARPANTVDGNDTMDHQGH
ncbi:copper chaperone PCu(A)C [Dyella subtropica]|uniref:copper chaperone PCu(A)C n=1 Tax=Dyella subtropica TaxID=2992127 RepID=UPI00224ED46F|nr:copper chaperone PCu(A)C [Dyella subtropica]